MSRSVAHVQQDPAEAFRDELDTSKRLACRWYDNDANGDLTIAALTRKRKRRFSSKAEAAYSYMGKIPFRYFRGDVLRQYVEHGFRPCPGSIPALSLLLAS